AGAAKGQTPAAPPPAKQQPAKAVPTEERTTAPETPAAGERPATEQVPEPRMARPAAGPLRFDAEGICRVPMSKIRRRIAERLVRAQQTAAMLTTFNEIDMSVVLDLRERHQTRFSEIHGVPLGLVSFFVRACVLALKQFPALNAEIEGDEI